MGVQSLVSFQLHMRMNGQYFGKYAYTEQMDEDSLRVRQELEGLEAACCVAGSTGRSVAGSTGRSGPGGSQAGVIQTILCAAKPLSCSVGGTPCRPRPARCGKAPGGDAGTKGAEVCIAKLCLCHAGWE